MTDTLKRLAGPTQVSAGDTTLLTAGASDTITIRNVTIVNPSAFTTFFKLGINGLTDDKLVSPLLPVGAGESAVWSGLWILEATDTLQVHVGGGGDLTITINGLDQS